jgi:hypothetical protein
MPSSGEVRERVAENARLKQRKVQENERIIIASKKFAQCDKSCRENVVSGEDAGNVQEVMR